MGVLRHQADALAMIIILGLFFETIVFRTLIECPPSTEASRGRPNRCPPTERLVLLLKKPRDPDLDHCPGLNANGNRKSPLVISPAASQHGQYAESR
jgi:hypothetical protein